ncbi:MAG: virulence RhuM family protein [Rhodoferax sp.]|nr:virulence RhuM family protein [Rhodoferax sp.]
MVQTEGEREVQRKVDHYSLQAIIAVGFKIENERAVQFRKPDWNPDGIIRTLCAFANDAEEMSVPAIATGVLASF